MGLVVTLYLITSNVYMNTAAPDERGFSNLEVWMVGVQIIILLALIEYGFLLAWKRYTLPLPKGCKGKKIAFMEELSLEDKMKIVDMSTFVISIAFFIAFNLLIRRKPSANSSSYFSSSSSFIIIITPNGFFAYFFLSFCI